MGRAATGTHVPRILVADDNTNIQKMVALAFEERGIDVTSVGNGEAAVRRMPDLNPDLVLADVFMPVRNGYEVCEFVKKDTRFAHVPVILLVGAFDPLDEKEARRVGADGVLKKPFVPPDPLIAMVTSALERNPKLAAELAKAKEVVVEPPKPIEPILETATKRPPAPLPEFPEPSPEEAAAIYGFGKGVRALDDEEGKAEPKPPVAHNDEQQEGEFDGAATSRDWRRSAGLGLEIPEGTTQEAPARSFGRDFTPITFPSERDVPPRHISEQELAAKEAAAKELASPESPAPVEEASPVAAQPEAAEAESMSAEPQSRPAPPEVPQPEPASLEQGEADAASTRTSELASKETRAPRSTDWMDMLAPAPSEYPAEASWQDAIEADAQPTSSGSTKGSAPAADEASIAAPESSKPWPTPEPEPATTPVSEEHRTEQPLFADDGASDDLWFSVPPVIHEVVQDTVRQAVREGAPESKPLPAPDFGHEIIVAPAEADTAPAHQDQEAAPSAFEKLFANGQTSLAAEHASLEQEAAAATQQRFPPAGMEEPSAYADEDAAAPPEDSPLHAESASAMFSERIPTAPPPNREALADIPFLLPPPPPVIDETTVDAVAQRVIEKLDPQLRNLLSRDGLRSLIESALQQETEKKSK